MNIFMSFMELIGVISFALSGAIVALKKEMDAFGVCIMSLTTAFGGGIVRDLIIDEVPPAVFNSKELVVVAILVSIITFIFCNKLNINKYRDKFNFLVLLSDSMGLGAFTIIGANAAINKGFSNNYMLVVAVATITGVGGGVLRDVFASEKPFIFVKYIYPSAAIVGAILYIILIKYVSIEISSYACAFIVVMIRLVSEKYNIHYPRKKI
ncbi:MAG: trimeric intracellular cation channel family protein [Eubacteriales bacterium]|nr:trimeric intracellular cation channel family protein [Eubacteriales bacterium]